MTTRETLESELKGLEAQRESINQQIFDVKRQLKDIREAEYWQANPGTVLHVDDNLLITEETMQWFSPWSADEKRGLKVGDPCVITSVNVDDQIVGIEFVNSWGGSMISIAIARRMREAWLAKYGEVTE